MGGGHSSQLGVCSECSRVSGPRGTAGRPTATTERKAAKPGHALFLDVDVVRRGPSLAVYDPYYPIRGGTEGRQRRERHKEGKEGLLQFLTIVTSSLCVGSVDRTQRDFVHKTFSTLSIRIFTLQLPFLFPSCIF